MHQPLPIELFLYKVRHGRSIICLHGSVEGERLLLLGVMLLGMHSGLAAHRGVNRSSFHRMVGRGDVSDGVNMRCTLRRHIRWYVVNVHALRHHLRGHHILSLVLLRI